MDYEIVKKAQFTVQGVCRRFNCDTAYEEIPKFWQEYMKSELAEDNWGTYGICLDENGKEFTYYIADDYFPWLDVPASAEVLVVPAHTWAVFPCCGELPKALQELNTAIWKEWLPSNGKYRLADSLSIELYTMPSDNSDEDYSEIWIPVEEV